VHKKVNNNRDTPHHVTEMISDALKQNKM